MVQRSGAERAHGLFKLLADPGDLGLGDAGVGAKGDHEVIDAASRDAVDVGLHHHRVERLVDAPTRLEDAREERALPELWDPHLNVASLGRQQPGAGAVAFGDAVLGALVTLRTNHANGFELDELLEHGAHRLADHVDAVAGAKRLQQLGQGRLRTWPSVVLLQCVTWSFHTEDPADGRLLHAAPPSTLKPHHSTGLSFKAALERGLQAELSEHLGYEKGAQEASLFANSRNGVTSKTVAAQVGAIDLDTPSDREGSFTPRLVPKGSRRLGGLDEMIVSLYAGGMTIADIEHHLGATIGTELSRETISKITDEVVDGVLAWQRRPWRRGF